MMWKKFTNVLVQWAQLMAMREVRDGLSQELGG
jgi:hypothetical protein